MNIHNLLSLLLHHLERFVYQHAKACSGELLILSEYYSPLSSATCPHKLCQGPEKSGLKEATDQSQVESVLRPDIDTWCAWAWWSSSRLLWRRSPRRRPWRSCWWWSGWPSTLEAGSRMWPPWPEILFCSLQVVQICSMALENRYIDVQSISLDLSGLILRVYWTIEHAKLTWLTILQHAKDIVFQRENGAYCHPTKSQICPLVKFFFLQKCPRMIKVHFLNRSLWHPSQVPRLPK